MLKVLEGVPVDSYFFGWGRGGWGDAACGTCGPSYHNAGVTEALVAGVLRYPGGTGSK